MSSVAEHPLTGWEALLRSWQELDVPEGWRPEITEDGATVIPPPGSEHNLIAAVLNDVLVAAKPEGCGVFQSLGVGVRDCPGIFIPDLVVARRTDVSAGSGNVPAERALLAVEITSRGNADNDRVRKLRYYALGGIPLYLLVDRFAPMGPRVTLFSRPRRGAYTHELPVPFGEPIDLPEPFAVTLATDEL